MSQGTIRYVASKYRSRPGVNYRGSQPSRTLSKMSNRNSANWYELEPVLPTNPAVSDVPLPMPSDHIQPTSRTEVLNNLLYAYQEYIVPSFLVDFSHPESSMHEVITGGMLSALTVSIAAMYLVGEALLSQPSEHVEFALGLPTALPWGFREEWDNSVEVPSLAILGTKFPKYILLPVVDRSSSHSYLWYIKSKKRNDSYKLSFFLIDSLGGLKDKTVLVERAAPALPLVQQLFPGCVLEYSYSQKFYLKFQQGPTLHCGFYVCQALSAALFGQLGSLNQPLEVTIVQINLASIIVELADGTFENKLSGHQPTTGIRLHPTFTKTQ
jgi:hypothetical protein